MKIINNQYLIKYRGKWYNFDKNIYNIGYFWVTPDVLKKQETEVTTSVTTTKSNQRQF